MVRSIAAVIVMLLCTTSSVFAAGPADEKRSETLPFTATAATPSLRRPAALPMLYATLAGLQIYDGYSTMKGRALGANEANPMMRWMSDSPGRFWSVKAATTTASILIAERMWKRNKVGALVTMAAINGVSAAVAARNASVLNQIR